MLDRKKIKKLQKLIFIGKKKEIEQFKKRLPFKSRASTKDQLLEELLKFIEEGLKEEENRIDILLELITKFYEIKPKNTTKIERKDVYLFREIEKVLKINSLIEKVIDYIHKYIEKFGKKTTSIQILQFGLRNILIFCINLSPQIANSLTNNILKISEDIRKKPSVLNFLIDNFCSNLGLNEREIISDIEDREDEVKKSQKNEISKLNKINFEKINYELLFKQIPNINLIKSYTDDLFFFILCTEWFLFFTMMKIIKSIKKDEHEIDEIELDENRQHIYDKLIESSFKIGYFIYNVEKRIENPRICENKIIEYSEKIENEINLPFRGNPWYELG